MGRTRRAAVRALVKSARESASWRRRSSAPRAPQPPWPKSARKRIPYKDEGYAPFRDPFLTLYFVQFASFAHFFCCIVLPRAPPTSMQVTGTFWQRLLCPTFADASSTFFWSTSRLMVPTTALSITRARSATYQYVRQNFAWPRGRVAAPAPAHAKK